MIDLVKLEVKLEELGHDLNIEKENWEKILKLQKENFIELIKNANSQSLANIFDYQTVSQIMKVAQKLNQIDIELDLIKKIKDGF